MRLRGATGAILIALLTIVPGGAFAATPRASYTDILNDVMCPSCREPLALAQSPQAYSERAFIQGLIAQGETKAQIERALVAQFGPGVLGKPPASGFNLTVYLLPPAVVAIGLITLAVTLPRWRRRSREAAPLSPPRARLAPADARRLEEDLARYDG
jgi:cytochrome c-type biogenesis protein CcmH